MTDKPRVYMAGPIDDSEDHGKGWRETLKDHADHIHWVDPLDKYDPDASYEEIMDKWDGDVIVEQDIESIEACDAMIVHWEDVQSVGTPMEVVYAVQVFEIPVIVQTEVEELSIWLDTHANVVVETLEDAVAEIEVRTMRSKSFDPVQGVFA